MPAKEYFPNPSHPTLAVGVGSIEPAPRLASGEITEERLFKLETDILHGRFYKKLSSDAIVPFMCVDGRLSEFVGPNSAGGTFTLVLADALTSNVFRQSGENASAHAGKVYTKLKEMKQRIGGHSDSLAHQPNGGCGAQDRLADILNFMSNNIEATKETVRALGVEVDDESSNRIWLASQKLQNENYVTSGTELSKVCQDVGGKKAVEKLPGQHHEVLLVVNTKKGTTLDRQELAQAYGDAYQIFNVDEWAVKESTAMIAASEQDAHDKYIAALFYNVATAAVLAGPSLRVIVR